jgi:transcription elongation factor GreA
MKSPIYLSSRGLTAVQAELAELTANERPAVIARISAARELGDLSENAEYETARKEQSILEGRIEYLTNLLREAIEIEDLANGIVGLGSTVIVEAGGGEETYTIVGSHEAAPAEGRISNTSPVGRALLGRSAGEVITVVSPAGPFEMRIVALS